MWVRQPPRTVPKDRMAFNGGTIFCSAVLMLGTPHCPSGPSISGPSILRGPQLWVSQASKVALIFGVILTGESFLIVAVAVTLVTEAYQFGAC